VQSAACDSALELVSMQPMMLHKMWDSRGTEAKPYPVAIWRAQVPDGFFIIGDLAARVYPADPPPASPMCVRELATDASHVPLLAPPVDYVSVWDDSKTGGTFGDCAIWEPVPPPGYVAMGHVVSQEAGVKPDSEDIRFRCVHNSVVQPGCVQHLDEKGYLWRYRTYYPKAQMVTRKCSLWLVGRPDGPTGLKRPLSAPPIADTNLFVTSPNYTPPSSPVFVFQVSK